MIEHDRAHSACWLVMRLDRHKRRVDWGRPSLNLDIKDLLALREGFVEAYSCSCIGCRADVCCSEILELWKLELDDAFRSVI